MVADGAVLADGAKNCATLLYYYGGICNFILGTCTIPAHANCDGAIIRSLQVIIAAQPPQKGRTPNKNTERTNERKNFPSASQPQKIIF